ncbi:MAG: hypothetical protein OHK0013_25680 [Sandaracinaceae bacterium]
MRHRSALGPVLALAAPAVALLATACRPPVAPGASLGDYVVTGTLEENTCGLGFQPEPLLRFPVELRRDGSTAYWRMGSGPRAEGTIDADGDFRFRYVTLIEGWPADPDNGVPPCRFTQTETIEGRIVSGALADAGSADGGLADAGSGDVGPGDAADAGARTSAFMSATSTIDLGVAAGFDCSLALQSAGVGGQFAVLPCRATYRFEGAPAE